MLLVVLLRVVVVVLLLEEALFVVEQHLAVMAQEDKVCVPLGNHGYRRMPFILDGTFNIQFVAAFLDADIYPVGIVGKPLLGFLDVCLGHGEHFKATFRVAMHHGHSHSYRQTYHAGTGDAHPHGVLEHIFAQSQNYRRRLAAKCLDGLGHAQRNSPGFCTACGRHHLVLHYILYLLADTLIHR